MARVNKVNTNDERQVLTVPEAGRRFGLGRNAAYEAARTGQIPTLRFGKLKRVSVKVIDRMLDGGGLASNPNGGTARVVEK